VPPPDAAARAATALADRTGVEHHALAETRMLRTIGADLVGLLPVVLLAALRHDQPTTNQGDGR
jgi:hypothetical protein